MNYLNSFKEKFSKFNMPLINNLVYEPEIKEIEKEEQVIELLKEVSEDMNHLIGYYAPRPLKEVLKIIEEGEYQIKGDKGIVNAVDLSQAKSMIQSYRGKSEGGCQSCKERYSHKPFPEDTLFYCNLSESPEELGIIGDSPKVSKFYKKGCKDKKPIFSKTIEQILEEN